jgi:hypothetical protein
MIERLTDGVTDPDGDTITWKHPAGDLVDAVDQVFALAEERAKQEGEARDTMEALFKILEIVVEAATDMDWPAKVAELAILAELAALGAGYAAAAETIKKDRVSAGFSEGVALGVMSEQLSFMKDKMWEWSPEANAFFPEAGKIGQTYYNAGLVLGYDFGRDLRGNMSQLFFRDLQRVNNPSLLEHGEPANFGPNDWRDYYIDLGAAFRQLHIDGD